MDEQRDGQGRLGNLDDALAAFALMLQPCLQHLDLNLVESELPTCHATIFDVVS